MINCLIPIPWAPMGNDAILTSKHSRVPDGGDHTMIISKYSDTLYAILYFTIVFQ